MNRTIDVIHSLRSIHGNFSDREVSDPDLETILQASVRAANSSARQPYSIVVVRDREVQRALGYVGSAMLVFCVDLNRQYDLAEYRGFERPEPNHHEFLASATDTAMAMQTACITAKSLGIDSLVTNCVHRGDISRVYRLLDLPEQDCFPLIALVLGYPDREPDHKKGRLNDHTVIHRQKYRRLDDRECARLTDVYDTPDMSLMQTNYRKRGYSHFLDWFFKDWFRYREKGEKREEISPDQPEPVKAALQKAGFCL